MTAGLGCDGDTIAMTAATQPSIEDIVLGALPWIPKVNFHNPFLANENGDEFLKPFHRRRKASFSHSFWWSKDRFPTRRTKRKATGLRGARTRRQASPSRPATGSTGSRPRPGRWSRPAPAQPTAAFMPWKAIPPGAWVLPITWAGSGNRRLTFPSSTSRAVRCSPTTSWRRCSTCFTWRREARR